MGKPVLLLYKNNADPNGIWYTQLLSEALQDETTQQQRDFYELRADCFQPLTDYLLEGQFTVAQLQKNLFN